MMLKLDTVGIIKSGEYSNQQVRVLDVSDESGLYMIFIGKDLSDDDEEISFSLVLETREKLQEHFDQSKWVIK